MQVLTSQEVREILENGGGNVNFQSRLYNPRSGYMVALEGYEHKVKASIPAVQRAVTKLWNENSRRGVYIGIWVDNGVAYIDVSIRVNTKAKAIELGKRYNQLAVWNNNRAIEIRLVD